MGIGFMRVAANKGRLMRGVGVNFGLRSGYEDRRWVSDFEKCLSAKF